MKPLEASGGSSDVRLEKSPVPTLVCQMSNSPLRSARKATNSPSGEISAPSSVPSQFVNSVKVAFAKSSGDCAGFQLRQFVKAVTMPMTNTATPMTGHQDPFVAPTTAQASLPLVVGRDSSANAKSRAD